MINISKEEYKRLLEIAIDNTEESLNEFEQNYCVGTSNLPRHEDELSAYFKDLDFLKELAEMQKNEINNCKLCEEPIDGERDIETIAGYHISCLNIVDLHRQIKSLIKVTDLDVSGMGVGISSLNEENQKRVRQFVAALERKEEEA